MRNLLHYTMSYMFGIFYATRASYSQAKHSTKYIVKLFDLIAYKSMFLQSFVDGKYTYVDHTSKFTETELNSHKILKNCNVSPKSLIDYFSLSERKRFVDEVKWNIYHRVIPNAFRENEKLGNSLLVLLSVSGGCDSVALLHSIKKILNISFTQDNIIKNSEKEKKYLEIELKTHVIHFDHQQRGSESDKDRLFVEKVCYESYIPFHCYFWDDDNTESTLFNQNNSRRWRKKKSTELLYELIENREEGKGLIFTAHHEDDSNETFWIKLLRGVHITNLSGMYIFDKNDIFAKPMLSLRKFEIKEYLNDQNLSWREDNSNESEKYFRNRVRNNLIPILHDLVGGEVVLQRRINNYVFQSRKLCFEISCRAEQYLIESNSNSHHMFILPRNKTLDTIQQRALYIWAKRRSQGKLLLSYEQIDIICYQLSDKPENQTWTLHVGSNWSIVRNSITLDLKMLYNENQTSIL